MEVDFSVLPKLIIDQRLCLSCNVVDDEEHFVIACKDIEGERALFIKKLLKRDLRYILVQYTVYCKQYGNNKRRRGMRMTSQNILRTSPSRVRHIERTALRNILCLPNTQ